MGFLVDLFFFSGDLRPQKGPRVPESSESGVLKRWIFPEINFIHFFGAPHDELEPPEFVELPSCHL